jgi:hypothetical protein
MPHNYIPNPDPAFDAWFQNYQQYAVANAVALGLTPAQALEIQTAKINWSLGYSNLIAARNSYQAAQEIKDEKREAGEGVIRKMTGIIQKRPETTDAQREGLGITVPDRQPTPLDPGRILQEPPPIVLVDTSQRLQATIHFGPNPSDERNNPKPEICTGAEIWYCYGAMPTDAAAMLFLALDTHSPYVQIFAGLQAVTITYRLRWVDRLGRPGPFSEPVTVTLTA